MQREKLAAIGLVVIIIIALFGFLLAENWDEISKNLFGEEKETELPEGAIEIGDCADVNYIGKFLNGTVFDTNLEDIALQWDLYDENRTYKPANVFVDPNMEFYYPPEGYDNYSADFVVGFLNGLVGMNAGETKNVTIDAEDAYGDWNLTFAEEIFEYYLGTPHWPRTVSNNILETITKTDLLAYNSSLDLDNLTVNQTFDYLTGISQEGENVTWQIQITNISDENVTIKNLVLNGTIIKSEGMWDNVVITENETAFTMRGDPEIDAVYGSPGFYMKVIDFNETEIVVAINVYANDIKFIGQTLVFQLEAVKVYNTSSQLES